ncbi:recombination protein NinG [Nissabacter archeti]|uniref:recombination protein NinG n=1 Tax=Nissabacter archeti TaxID=1917880 RepID=UPI0009333366|nr:recombination protein NinG [Nissabacter archeti]
MAKGTKPPKARTCPICSTEYTPRSTTQKVCHSYKCAIEFTRLKGEEKAAREARKQHREERKEWNKRKADVKPLSHWLNMTQRVFNDYIRARDEGQGCISCGSTTAVSYHAGHFRTTAAASQLRFNEDNCNLQCSACNTHHSGNIWPYRINLIAKIGLQRVIALESDNQPHRYTREELDTLRARYRKKLRELIKHRQEAA